MAAARPIVAETAPPGGRQPLWPADFDAVAFALLAAGFGAPSVAAAFGLASAAFFWRFLAQIRRVDLPFWKSLQLAGIHYIANVSFSTAAFVGGLRVGMIFVPATIFPPQTATHH